MKKLIAIVAVCMVMGSPITAHATSDKDIATTWMHKHCKGGHVEVVNTTALGGYKGKAGKYTVRYPKKVAKGKKVKVYMVVKKGDVKAMVCCGKVK